MLPKTILLPGPGKTSPQRSEPPTHSFFSMYIFVAYSVPVYADKSILITVVEVILENVLFSKKKKTKLKLFYH